MLKLLMMSNLLLSDKIVRVNALNSLEKMGENQWTALRAAHQLTSEKPLSSVLVDHSGLEPLASSMPWMRSTR